MCNRSRQLPLLPLSIRPLDDHGLRRDSVLQPHASLNSHWVGQLLERHKIIGCDVAYLLAKDAVRIPSKPELLVSPLHQVEQAGFVGKLRCLSPSCSPMKRTKRSEGSARYRDAPGRSSPQYLHNSGRLGSTLEDCCELDREVQPVRNQALRSRSHAPSIGCGIAF